MPQNHIVNRKIVLNSRPVGAPTGENFRLDQGTVPVPAAGQLLLRTIYLSLDPYMRGRMSDVASYAKPVALGEVMGGGTVSRVETSNHADYGERLDEFTAAMSEWLKAGKINFREDIVDGLDNAAQAFIGLLEGKNFGKLIIRVATD